MTKRKARWMDEPTRKLIRDLVHQDHPYLPSARADAAKGEDPQPEEPAK